VRISWVPFLSQRLSLPRLVHSAHNHLSTVIFDESRFPFADGSPAPDSSLLDFLVDDTVNTMPCGPSPAAPAAAPFPEDIEQPPPPPLHAGPGGRGPVPPPGPAASTSLGGRGLVPLPGLQQARPAAPRDAAGLVPALPHVYVRRPPAPTSPPVPVPAAASESSRPVTRTQSGAIPRVQYRGLTATTPSPIPANNRSGLADPNWRAAMADEYKALMDNGTWRLVPRPPGANVVSGKWIFKHKYHSDGTLARHKARWVVRGFSQQHGIDYDETFSPVVKPPTIRAVLSITASRSWPIRQLDVKNAFLHGHLEETVYCQQPPGFVDPAAPDHVCLLQRSLYGLKQAPRAWYQRFATYIRQLGFTPSTSDVSLFVYKEGGCLAYLLLYVDDIILTASSPALLQRIINRLHSEFAMTDLGDLHHFLNISVERSSDGLFLSQRQYAIELLQRAGMSECHSTATPVDTRTKLSLLILPSTGASPAPFSTPR